MADEKWKNFERQAVQRPISDAIWIAYGDVEEMHRELRTESAYLSMVDYVGKLSKFWEMRRAIIPAEGLAQYDAMRGDEAKSQIEERYRKAQADKEYANRVIEERKQQAKENAARRNAEIEEQRRKIAERKAAEEEARKTKPDDITLAERDDVSVEEMRPGTARLPSEGVFQTLDRRVMGDSDVILRNALMPYGDWNRATADALADFDLERFTTKEQRDAYLGRPRARRPGVAKEALSAETLFSAAGTANNDGMSFGAADLFQGAGIDLMIMTVGSFGLQTGMSSALSALTKMRIGTVIVDIINGRSAEEIVKNFFKYPVDWATDTIQFIAELSQQIYDWASRRGATRRASCATELIGWRASWAPDFWVCTTLGGARNGLALGPGAAVNEIKEPKELQAFIRALDNSINDYRTPRTEDLLEIDRATVLFLSQLTVKMQEGFGSTSLALSRLMRDLKQMIKEETKGRKRVLIAVYQEGLNRINHIEALRREFGSAIRHSGVSSNGGRRWPPGDANSRLEIPGPSACRIGQPVFASQNYEWHMAPGASQAVSTVGVAVPQLATVAHTGAYADLSGRPTIPVIPTTWAWDSITGSRRLTVTNGAWDGSGYTTNQVTFNGTVNGEGNAALYVQGGGANVVGGLG
eukprot:tig00021290_g19988.t1